MRTLLRFQAVALAQAFAPWVIVPLAGLAVLVTLGAFGLGDGSHVGMAFVFGMPVVFLGMTRGFEALDAVRWVVPIRREHALRAYFGFWLMVLSPLILVVAIGRSRDALGAAILVLHLVAVVVGAAAIVMFYQRITRRGSGAGAMLAGVVVGSVLVWPTGWSFYLAWTGRWESLVIIDVVACICWALGVPQFLRDELAPSATGAVIERRASRAYDSPPVAVRSPTATLLRATYPSSWTFFWVFIGGVFPLCLMWTHIFAILPLIAASSLAAFGLQSWRWLSATPINRDHAFRILFGPALAFVLVVTATHLVLIETMSDRTVFFDDYRRETFCTIWTRGPETYRPYDLLDRAPDGRSYLPPEPQVIASRVQRRLRKEYGLQIPEQRIAADILRGWPEHPSTGIMDTDQTTVYDAMERVRVDLAVEIAGAGRRRDFVIAGALVLAFLVMLRAQFRARPLGVLAVLFCLLPLSTLSVFRRKLPAFAEATDHAYVALIGAPPLVLGLASVAACALGVFLWYSARKAFRRIDVLDIPPDPLVSRRR